MDTIVQAAWDRAKLLPGASLAKKTGVIHASLHDWDKEVLQGPRTQLRDLQKQLNEVMSGPITDDSLSLQHELQIKIEEMLEKEELYWMQRGRLNWLCSGDQNTAYFHRSASARKKKNFVEKLKDDHGTWLEEEAQLSGLASAYFSHLFSAEVLNPNPATIAKVQPRVTDEMNLALTAPYTREEVKKALFNIGDLKAPGPDGLHEIGRASCRERVCQYV